MKKILPILICFLVAMTSCHKSGVNLFSGDYSFKTSGEISIKAQAVIDSINIDIPAEFNANSTSAFPTKKTMRLSWSSTT